MDLDMPMSNQREGGAAKEGRPNHQNPNRVKCPTCGWWHDPTRGEKCKCPPKPTTCPLPRLPRVQEAELEVYAAGEERDAGSISEVGEHHAEEAAPRKEDFF
jgi:hypothetical protein